MRRVLAATACALGAVLATGGPAAAKSYHFPEVSIDAKIHPDGTLELRERRTFAFDGDFSFAFFNISPVHAPPAFVEGFAIAEDGAPVPFTTSIGSNGGFEARWDFAASDERRTWEISYRVRCAVDVYDDAAHLLWQFVGTGWTEPTDHVLVTVHVPGRAARPVERAVACAPGFEAPPAPDTVPLAEGEVRAWGHGPLGGEVRLPDPQTVTLQVPDLEPGAFVEGSILMPPEAVPVAALSPGGPGRTRILAQEGAAAREANEARRTYTRNRGITRGLLVGVPMALLLLVLLARARDRVPGVPRLLEEPPERIHPVELAYLWAAYRGRYLPKTAYRTQLLHVARQGAVELSAVGRVTDPEDLRARLRRRPKAGMDRDFVDFLFPDEDREVSLDELDAKGKRRKRLRAWGDAVQAKTKAAVERIREAGPRTEAVLAATVAVFAVVWWFAAEFAGGLGAAAAGLGVVGWIVALRFMAPRLPHDLRERVARWAAFRRFLRSFSSLEEAPALAVVVWERYLVLATALGVADEVEEQVRALVPAGELPAPWEGGPSGAAGLDLVRGFGSAAPLYAPTPVSASGSSSGSFSSGVGSFSSSSGGGGGFSGGGGGGGGGTGGGAG